MADLHAASDPRSRLELRAIRELLRAQRRRVQSYATLQRHPEHIEPPAGVVHGALPTPGAPSSREVLDALPLPALLVTLVFGNDGTVRDALYVDQNAAARAYAAARFPQGALAPWTGPVSLYERFPRLGETPLPAMLTRAFHDRTVQGPETVEWVLNTASGPVRINEEVQVSPCGEHHLLLTWERGQRRRIAAAAQYLVRTCWAEWNLGDDGVEPSFGFRRLLGLADDAPLPTLSDLAGTVTTDSLPGLYQTLYEVILRKHTTSCELRLSGGKRVLRMTAEPVRVAPGSLVWALRAVLTDVTAERLRRDTTEHAEREARRQRERAETVAEIAGALREAVLPHFQDEPASYGIEAAAVYRPDAREAGVGGDWYKARGLPDGRLLVTLGDARGHGLEAVTVMAKLRFALAGLAYTEDPVEQLTGWLNELACADGLESTATAIIARYHPERSLLRWTCAGHPRPVLLRGARATQLPFPDGGPGLPLGVLPGTVYTAAETLLRPGDIVLMYTDGLVERRDTDPDHDTRRFLEAAEHCLEDVTHGAGHEVLQDYAERVVTRLDGPHRTDDATLLALRATSQSAVEGWAANSDAT